MPIVEFFLAGPYPTNLPTEQSIDQRGHAIRSQVPPSLCQRAPQPLRSRERLGVPTTIVAAPLRPASTYLVPAKAGLFGFLGISTTNNNNFQRISFIFYFFIFFIHSFHLISFTYCLSLISVFVVFLLLLLLLIEFRQFTVHCDVCFALLSLLLLFCVPPYSLLYSSLSHFAIRILFICHIASLQSCVFYCALAGVLNSRPPPLLEYSVTNPYAYITTLQQGS